MASHGVAWRRMASHGVAWRRMASHFVTRFCCSCKHAFTLRFRLKDSQLLSGPIERHFSAIVVSDLEKGRVQVSAI
jgi:hypothetical protein